jgi:predicted transcriptional regulator
MDETTPELLQFFKALSDETRLKMVGLLANGPRTGEELAALLGVKPATVSHHLSRLAEAGLVSAQADGHYHRYTLHLAAIQQMAERLLAHDTLPRVAEDLSADAEERKVFRDFGREDGSLKALPVQQKKFLAVLRRLVREFQPGERYTEKQVNAILARFHPDTASLRRALIEYKFMQRASGQYWRLGSDTKTQVSPDGTAP